MNFVLIAKELLRKLSKALPPAPGARHNITLDESDRVILTLATTAGFIPIVIDEFDTSRDSVDGFLNQLLMLIKPQFGLTPDVSQIKGENKSDNK